MRPCPFCESTVISVDERKDGGHGGGPPDFYMKCRTCGATGPSVSEYDHCGWSKDKLKAEAKNLWETGKIRGVIYK